MVSRKHFKMNIKTAEKFTCRVKPQVESLAAPRMRYSNSLRIHPMCSDIHEFVLRKSCGTALTADVAHIHGTKVCLKKKPPSTANKKTMIFTVWTSAIS